MKKNKLPIFDKQKSRRSFDRAAHQYDQHAQLQRCVAATLLEYLDEYSSEIQPQFALDIGCGTGQITEGLCQRYPNTNVAALDFSSQMLLQTEKRLAQQGLSAISLCADAEQLPFQDESLDLVVSSLMLQWANDLQNTLARIHSLLTSNGVLAFSSFSTGTLKEVKASWDAVDDAAHSSDFLSLDSFRTITKAAGYSKVTIIPQTIIVRYETVREMLMEMKGIGASNARSERVTGLTGKQRFRAFEQALEAQRLPDGGYPCTWEVTYIICAK